MADAFHAPFEDRAVSLSVLWIVTRPEAQAVHSSDRPCAHREDIPQDPPNACRCSLKWLDERRVIMRFNLERHTPTVADINDPGIFARRNDHTRPARRQSLKM